MAKVTPMQRTLAVLKKQDIMYDIAQHWNHYAKCRIDLFGIIDVVTLDKGIKGIQVCGADLASHKTKMGVEKAEKTKRWLQLGGLLEIHAWRKLVKKKRGMKAKYWHCKVVNVFLVHGDIVFEEAE